MRSVPIPPPIQALFWGLCMWCLAYFLPEFKISFTGQKPISYLLTLIGLSIDIVCVLSFIRAKTTINPINITKASQLVIVGLYRFSRNPMYLGLLIILIAWGVRLGSPLNLIFIVLFVYFINILQIKPEEAVLKEKFGMEYLTYMEKVRRWL